MPTQATELPAVGRLWRDRAFVSSRRCMAIVLGCDGFWALRVDGAWTRSPHFRFTVRDWDDFGLADNVAAIIDEARAAIPRDAELLGFAGLPDAFPPGTTFAEWEGYPLSKEPDSAVRSWETSPPRRGLSHRFNEATLLNEGQFRALVSLLHCGPNG